MGYSCWPNCYNNPRSECLRVSGLWRFHCIPSAVCPVGKTWGVAGGSWPWRHHDGDTGTWSLSELQTPAPQAFSIGSNRHILWQPITYTYIQRIDTNWMTISLSLCIQTCRPNKHIHGQRTTEVWRVNVHVCHVLCKISFLLKELNKTITTPPVNIHTPSQ